MRVMTRYPIRDAEERDAGPVVRIFNYYVQHSFGAYPEEPVPVSFYAFLREGAYAFPVVEHEEGVIGFAILKPFLPFSTFNSTGSVTYFIAPEYTRSGLGTLLLNTLLDAARGRGLHILVASISSRNPQSLNFHKKHGFRECGRLERIGMKFGERFDVIWMQRDV
jgi:L-amino acid N-acyltransferase YncA